MGALGLAALVPLARAERRRAETRRGRAPADPAAGGRDPRLPLRPRRPRSTAETLRHVDDVILVDDGAPAEIAALLERRRARPARAGRAPRRQPRQGHRGRRRASRPRWSARPDAVIVLDSDGQHPPELIPAFVAAAAARRRRDRRPPARRRDAGCPAGRQRRLELGAQPRRRPAAARHPERHAPVPRRRAARRAAVTGPLRGRDAPPQGAHPRRPRGRLGADARDLRRRAELVPRRRRHAARHARGPRLRRARPPPRCAARSASGRRGSGSACCSPGPSRRRSRCWRRSTRRCSSRSTASATGRSGSTRRSTRTAATTCCWRRRPRWACSSPRAACASPAARCWRWPSPACSPTSCSRSSSSASTARGRRRRSAPRSQRSHGRHWSHIPSFPSGHLIVTTALVVAAATMAPRLRVPAFAYLAAIAVTRITFGAHFPLDVAVGDDRRLAGRPLLRRPDARGRAASPQRSRSASDLPAARRRSARRSTMPSAAPASTSSQK